ncbi:ABC transporter permease [Candidatus Pyrohabitans sp.]
MRLLALAKKEFEDILSERLYLLAFVVQLFIVVSITFVALLYTSIANPEVMGRYVPSQQVSIGIVGDASMLELENLRLVNLEDEDHWRALNAKRLVAVLVAPANMSKAIAQGGAELTLYIDNTNVLSGYADAEVTKAVLRLEENLRREAAAKLVHDPEAIFRPIRLEVGGMASALPAEFVELMYGLLVPFILLLPTFLAVNMTTDAIVGEKERRTYELLLVAPLSYREIILGKALPIAGIALVQALLWVLLLTVRGIPVYNIPTLLLLLAVLDVLFIALGVALSALSDCIKDANVGVTVLLIATSLAFFAPVSLKNTLYEISPVTLIAELASNPAVPLSEVLPGFVLLAMGAVLTLIFGEKLLEYRENLRV